MVNCQHMSTSSGLPSCEATTKVCFRYHLGARLHRFCRPLAGSLGGWDGKIAVELFDSGDHSQQTSVILEVRRVLPCTGARPPHFSGCVWHFPDGIGCEQRRGCHGGTDRRLVMWSTLQAAVQSLLQFFCPPMQLDRWKIRWKPSKTIGHLLVWGLKPIVSSYPNVLADVLPASGAPQDCAAIDASRCRLWT